MKRIFIIDWLLLLTAGLSGYSGIELHVAGFRDTHEVWHNWAVVHVLVSLLFLIFGIWHIVGHWNWYKAIFRGKTENKSKVTMVLSLLFFLMIMTGVVLIFVHGANSHMGLWHYRAGLAAVLVSMGHVIRRMHILRKSLKS